MIHWKKKHLLKGTIADTTITEILLYSLFMQGFIFYGLQSEKQQEGLVQRILCLSIKTL